MSEQPDTARLLRLIEEGRRTLGEAFLVAVAAQDKETAREIAELGRLLQQEHSAVIDGDLVRGHAFHAAFGDLLACMQSRQADES